jgi:hypothetical protein
VSGLGLSADVRGALRMVGWTQQNVVFTGANRSKAGADYEKRRPI